VGFYIVRIFWRVNVFMYTVFYAIFVVKSMSMIMIIDDDYDDLLLLFKSSRHVTF